MSLIYFFLCLHPHFFGSQLTLCANIGSLPGPAANHKTALPSEYGLRTGIRGMGVGPGPGFGPGCEFLSQPLLSNRRSQLFCLITRSTVHCTTILLHLFRWLLPRIPRRVALAPSDVQYDPGIGLMLLMPLLWACRLPVAGAGAGGHTSACRQPGMDLLCPNPC